VPFGSDPIDFRRQIDQLKAGKDAKELPDKESPLNSETPAEFIHRRMEELDSAKKVNKGQ